MSLVRPAGPRLWARCAGIAAAALAAGIVGCAASGARPGTGSASHARVWRSSAPDTLGPVVAIVGTRRITRHDVDSLLLTVPEDQRQSYRTPEAYRKVVDYMVDRELALQAAIRDGIDRDSSFRAELATTTRDLMIRHYYRAQMARMPDVSDSAARAYYEGHPSQFEVPERVRVRHIQVASQAKARAVLKRLKSGATWDAVCKESSTDGATRTNGGVLGYISGSSDEVPGLGSAPSIQKAALALKEGETSAPLKSARGWHVVRVDTKEPASKRSYESAKTGILAQLRSQQRDTYGLSVRDSLMRYSGATVFAESISVALNPRRTPQQLFEEAQSAIDPNTRIQLYKALIKEYPKDRVSIQALFMIGFTYAEDLGEYDDARTTLEDFLKKYPDSDLANSAKWMLENMEKANPAFDDGAPADSAKAGPAPGGTHGSGPGGSHGGGSADGTAKAPWQ